MEPNQVMSDELKKQRDKLIKAIDQGRTIENLTAAPEWEFFEGWIQATRKKLVDKIVSADFVNDHNGYLYTTAQVSAIDMVLKAVDAFKTAGKRSEKALERLDSTNE